MWGEDTQVLMEVVHEARTGHMRPDVETLAGSYEHGNTNSGS
jgi:hypothetical protein